MFHNPVPRVITLFLMLALSGISHSHEGRPVYIDVKVSEGGQYSLRWKIPPVVETGSEPSIRLDATHCQLISGKIEPALTGQKTYQCLPTETMDEVQTKIELVLNYPRGNPVLSTLVQFETVSGEIRNVFSSPGHERILLSKQMTPFSLAKQYVVAGITHILSGYDHLLFVLCLMQIAINQRRLLFIVSAFTLAHSLTLAIATLGWSQIRIDVVEVLISLSVVMLLAEVFKAKQTGLRAGLMWRYPAIVVSLFGLLHGFGFASALGELGLPANVKIPALAYFNIGVELGQVFFILSVLTVLSLIKRIRQSLPGWQEMTNTQLRVLCNSPASVVQVPNAILYSAGVMSAYWFVKGIAGIFVF